MSIGENIRTIREQRGMKQVELADKLLVSQAYISRVERDRKAPTLPMRKAIAEALGCTRNDLIYGKEVNKDERS